MYLRGKIYLGFGGKPGVTCYSRTNISAARIDSAPGWSDCFSLHLRRIYNRVRKNISG